MTNKYKNLIFTTHAYNRAKSRNINSYSIFETIKSPDKKIKKENSSYKYIKTISGRKYHVVATYKSKEKKYLIISVWVRGEDDKVPLMWQIITLPFKILFWIIKFLYKIVWHLLKKVW